MRSAWPVCRLYSSIISTSSRRTLSDCGEERTGRHASGAGCDLALRTPTSRTWSRLDTHPDELRPHRAHGRHPLVACTAVRERPVRYSRYTAVVPGSSPLNSPCTECALIGAGSGPALASGNGTHPVTPEQPTGSLTARDCHRVASAVLPLECRKHLARRVTAIGVLARHGCAPPRWPRPDLRQG